MVIEGEPVIVWEGGGGRLVGAFVIPVPSSPSYFLLQSAISFQGSLICKSRVHLVSSIIKPESGKKLWKINRDFRVFFCLDTCWISLSLRKSEN